MTTRYFPARVLRALAALMICSSVMANTAEPNPIPAGAEWQSYYKKSAYWQQVDKTALENEVKKLGLTEAKAPANTTKFGFELPENNAWFKTAEGKGIMAAILSFQTPSGGWSKRTDMSQPRQAGQAFGVEEEYIPTFDNDATSTQLQLLARAYTATGNNTYAKAFARGLQIVLDAQYPNGGWPQNYPLVGGYHDHITYNDNLMADLLEILHSAAQGKGDYAFVNAKQRKAAAASFTKGLDCVLKTQIKQNGKLTIWGGQHDRVTLAPAKARNFEMASLATSESVALVNLMMTLEKPDATTVQSVHAAAKWFEANKITGQRYERGATGLVADEKAPPVWARFYELGTDKPIFGDRNNAVYYSLAEVSEERRKGYSWYNTAGNKLLKDYNRWAELHPAIAR